MEFFADRTARGGAVLAPMAGYTDAPFRRLCREHGSAWAVTEMVSAKAMARGDRRTELIGAPYPGEPDLVIQLFAADPDEAATAAVRLRDAYRPAAFDLNMGCPVRKVIHKGCGVQLMRRPDRAAAIVRAIRGASGLPVSVKTRLGPDEVLVDEVADAVVEAGAGALAVHGRTGAQKYAGRADWGPIAALAARLPIPVLGSGDVADPADYRARRRLGVHVMIARGALGRPWIFDEVRGGAAPPWPRAAATLLRHARLQAAWYGEARGVRSLRGHLARYVAPYPEGAALRSALVRVDTVAQIAAILGRTAPAAPEPPRPAPVRTRATMPRSPHDPGDGGTRCPT